MTTNKYWIYLEELRKSGVTNMYGAASWLMVAFNLSHDDFAASLAEGFQTFYKLKNEITESINVTRQIPLTEDIEALAKELQEKTMLPEEVTCEVLNLIDKNYQRNRWGLINGITEVAQRYTLERRIELETIAGTMLV